MMRRTRWPVLIAALAAVPVIGRAEEQAEIDRKDARAVAEAYVQACREGNVDRAIGLLVPDERVRTTVRRWAEGLDDAGAPGTIGMTMGEMFLEFQFVPVEFGIERRFAEATEDGAHARVTFRSAFTFDQQVILVRQKDGTWAIDFLESAKATTGKEKSFFDVDTAVGEARGIPDPEAMAEQMRAMMVRGAYLGASGTSRLQRLRAGLLQYACDHDERLPPAETWADELELYVLDRAAFGNPDAPDLEFGYAMNADIGGRQVDDLWGEGPEAQDPLLFIEFPSTDRNAVVRITDVPRIESVRDDVSIRYVTCLGEEGTLSQGMTWEEERKRGLAEVPVRDDDLDREARDRYNSCRTNLYAITEGIRRYATQHQGMLPPADAWQDETAAILLELEADRSWQVGGGGIFQCPAAPDIELGYAINEEIAGKNALHLANHDNIILLFECDLNVPNAAGSPERAAAAPRHQLAGRDAPVGLVAYLSGTVGELAEEQDMGVE